MVRVLGRITAEAMASEACSRSRLRNRGSQPVLENGEDVVAV